jgi:predicted ferric reductase
VDFTIKQVGDFAGSMRKLRRGDRVYLDGAHGSVTLESHPGRGYVFVAAGVGVTPFLSMLAALADRGDQRPCRLVLGNRHEDQVTASASSPACRLGSTVVSCTSSVVLRALWAIAPADVSRAARNAEPLPPAAG